MDRGEDTVVLLKLDHGEDKVVLVAVSGGSTNGRVDGSTSRPRSTAQPFAEWAASTTTAVASAHSMKAPATPAAHSVEAHAASALPTHLAEVR